MTIMILSETYGIILLSMTLVHLLLLIERLKICQCEIFSSKFVRQPTAILISSLLAHSLLEIHLLTVRQILRLGEKALQGQVGVLTRMVALHVLRVVEVVAWWCCISWWTRWLYVAASNYQINSKCSQCKNCVSCNVSHCELQRLAFDTKGEFTDIAHKDDCYPVSFVEYAYAVKTTQPNVPRNFQEEIKMSDADLWREEAEKEIKSPQDINVYKLVPRSTVPPGQRSLAPSGFLR